MSRLGRCRLLLALIVWTTACSAPHPIDYTTQFEVAGRPAVEIRVTQALTDRTTRERSIETVRGALQTFGEWFGPYTSRTLTLAIPKVPSPWPSRTASRRLEDVVARLVAREFWTASPDTSRASDLASALVDYSVDRFLREAYPSQRALELPLFGGVLPWVVRGVSVASPAADASRSTRALLTLERYLGWPVLQECLERFRGRSRGVAGDATGLLAVAGEVAGRDLAWMIDLFDPAVRFDYLVHRIDQVPSEAGREPRVEVTIRRAGDGRFTGTSRQREGRFEAGQGVSVAVMFADGQRVVETWDGRDEERRFVYESRVPVLSATVDPDAVLAVDVNRANNTLIVSGTTRPHRAASVAWAARWAVWLQQRLLLWTL